MSFAAKQIASYLSHHYQGLPKLTHFISVPCLTFAVFQLLTWIHLAIPNELSVPFAWVVTLILGLYYLWLDMQIGLAMVVILILFDLICALAFKVPTTKNFEIFMIIFIIGFIAQFTGRFVERRKPILKQDFAHLIIAPFALMAEIYFALGRCLGLKNQVEMEIRGK